MMIAIKNIASYIPEKRISNFERKKKFDIEDDFIVEKLGVHQVSRKADNEETSDLCLKAFQALKEKTDKDINNIDCLVVCTQNPDNHGIPHTSAIVHGKLDLPEDCAAFDISLGCSGYVYSISVVKAFMEANGMKKGLLFTADPYSKTVDPDDKNTSLLFGDAATVTLLSEGDGILIPTAFQFATKGKSADALHNQGKHLYMNGRLIFNFSAVQVPIQVNTLLSKENLRTDDIDSFIFHQGSKYIVDQLQKRLGIPAEKVALQLKDHGNTISSSIPLILEKYLENDNMKKIIISGFGVGLSWASALLIRQT